ncbi:2960_t:CDS:2 [Acaulospora morrowiae]|uniref:2960_t:CDS:1 n=1 Tax=Acaulospora morrowiae TaxID=94023 RepID=A0A9N9FSS5_9GLOM|nr:2960_t:CDS:2 [Acaulospora morrowiae]
MSTLPNEILQKIFRELFHSDAPFQLSYRDLFNCTLVDRRWCSLAVPILWTDPLRRLDVLSKPCNLIVTTYLSFMDDVEREKLNHVLGPISLPSNAIFNYPSFLRILDINAFDMAVSRFICSFEIRKKREMSSLKIFLLCAIFKILESQCTNLRGLLIAVHYPVCDILPLLNDSKLRSLVKPVKRMKFEIIDNSDHNLSLLAESVHNLEYLELWQKTSQLSNPKKTIANIISLLRSQYYLTSLKIGGLSKGIHQIISSLPTLSSTLFTIDFSHINFIECGPMRGLAACEKLEKMSFYCCENLTSEMWRPLTKVPMKALVEVVLYDTRGEWMNEWSKRECVKILEDII